MISNQSKTENLGNESWDYSTPKGKWKQQPIEHLSKQNKFEKTKVVLLHEKPRTRNWGTNLYHGEVQPAQPVKEKD